ncbi:unnamed protein product [Mesocestoides corti]|uniref:40S ribosomal protein S6 n=1 Tax=Mesocestoides corti TaxID=53468 RepID=A0A0R3UGU5_MESCO|nr:unnamed protein product [Mesocestoides corti]
MPQHKSKVAKKSRDETAVDEEEPYFVSVRDLPFDVLRQRINQSAGADRRAARKELLLKMGAKPERQPPKNYRVLMEERKQAKLAAITDYKNERFKRTVLERQLGKHSKNKKQKRKALRSEKGKKKSSSSAITRIPNRLVKKIRRKK